MAATASRKKSKNCSRNDRTTNGLSAAPPSGLIPPMIDRLHELFWNDGTFQWVEIIGWLGNAVFFSRFFIQWYATERKKQVVVPAAFWWISLAGSLLLLFYAIFAKPKPHHRNWVFIASYAFTWIPYIRNLIIHRRHKEAHL